MSGLPWFKVYVGVPDHQKVTALMALLEEPLADAYVLRLWDFCADKAPTGRVPGKAAVFAIERAVRWAGKRGALVAAMQSVGLLEKEGEDLLVHDWPTLQGAHVAKVERDRGKPDGRKGSRQNPAREIGGSAAGARAESPETPAPLPPDARAGNGPETPESREGRVESRERREEEKPAASARAHTRGRGGAAPVGASRPAPAPEAQPQADSVPEAAFFAWCQEARLQAFPQALPDVPPPGWGSWYAEAMRGVGGDEERLRGAWRAYLADEWGRARRPVCAARAFCGTDGRGEVWRRLVPGQDAPAQRQESAGPQLPNTEAGRAWGQLLDALRGGGFQHAALTLSQGQPKDVRDGELLVGFEGPDMAAWCEEHFAERLREFLGEGGPVRAVRFFGSREAA